MFIVTGATGHLGHAIVEKLVERVAANQVGASARDPSDVIAKKVGDLTSRPC